MPCLTVCIGCSCELPRQFLADIDVVEDGREMLFEPRINILSMVVRNVEIGHECCAIERFPLSIALHLPTVLPQVVSVCAVANIVSGIDQGANAVVIVGIMRNKL